MEEVDEGFGSNESNHSNPNKEDLLNDLKCLNGQKVLDTDSKLDKIFCGNICENGNSIIDRKLANEPDKNGCENDLELTNHNEGRMEELSAPEANLNTQPVEDNDEESRENESSLKEKIDDELEEETQKDITEAWGKGSKNEIPNNSDDTKETNLNSLEYKSNASDQNTDDDDFDKVNDCVGDPSSVNGCKDDSVNVNGGYETDSAENTLDKNCLDEIDRNGTRSLENTTTPVKLTNSAEGERSPFLLDDKVRNSLKGLVAKVKSLEVPSPAGSSTSGDGDGPANPELSITDHLVKQDSETEKANNLISEETVDDESSVGDPDDCILDDNEDGIAMEIGSENEDDLLELDTENKPFTECNNKSDTASTNDSNEDMCPKTNSESNLSFPETEESNSHTPLEISSDVEETSTEGTKKTDFKPREDSVEKMQFEDDSNSNGSSGRINAIVDFLNHDLSGTNSPLVSSDSNKTEENDDKVDNNMPISVEDNDTKGDNEEQIKEKQIEHEKIQCDSDDLQQKQVNGIKELSGEDCHMNDSESDCDEPAVETSLALDCDSDVSEKKDFNKEDSSQQVNESNAGQTALVSEKNELTSENEPAEDEEDDDVIFEGASMPEMRNEFQRRDLSGTNIIKPSEIVKVDNSKKEDNSERTENVEEDDDVIFEKETKPEISEPKQNCDIIKSMGSANNEKLVTDENESNTNAKVKQPSDIEDTAMDPLNDKNVGNTAVRPTNNSSDRKRSAEDKDLGENDTKRSKLDLSGLIGRLGSRVEPASIEVSDEDEDEKSAATGIEENETPPVLAKNEKEEDKLITVTEKELEDLVREKVKQYLTSQRDTLIAKLSQKVKELQLNNDLWKRQVKDLQVKVNDVTVLQQKLEKRKAATAALRQITTRNVAVQVDEGRRMSASTVIKQMLATKMCRESTPFSGTEANSALPLTSSSKNTRASVVQPKEVAKVPYVTSPVGTGTIRLPIPHTSVTPALPTQLFQGSKVVTTTFQTPSVKSLLDTTRIQKTVGSLPSTTTTTIGTSMIGLVQYPTTYVAKPNNSQGFIQPTVTQIQTHVTTALPKTVNLTSANPAKVIDLTDDDDSSKTRLVTLQTGVNTVSSQGVRHVIAPPGTQFVRTGLPNQPTYQLVLTSPPSSIRPGVMMTVASAVTQGTSLLQAVPQSPTVVSQSPAIAPGTTLARAAVPATTSIATLKPAPPSSHPAPFPSLPFQTTANLKGLPQKPSLKISRVSQGIVLSWNMTLNDSCAEISNYQLFAYQETSALPAASLWKKVGDVKALPLPMACTLTQFQVGNKYHFAVRAMDIHSRVGQFSDPGSIHLTPSTPTK